jgi:hypothetical protein
MIEPAWAGSGGDIEMLTCGKKDASVYGEVKMLS